MRAKRSIILEGGDFSFFLLFFSFYFQRLRFFRTGALTGLGPTLVPKKGKLLFDHVIYSLLLLSSTHRCILAR